MRVPERALRRFSTALGVTTLIAGLGVGTAALATPAAAQAPHCVTAAGTGLTTARVARTGQTFTGAISAQGCDVGIFVGPGVSHVTIKNATVTGANDHGIFAENATRVTVVQSVVTDVGHHPHVCKATGARGCINEDKPIELSGTTHSVVDRTVVTANDSDGGIGISDNGMLDPGALSPGIPHAASDNLIEDNVDVGNGGGCGIVVAAYDPHAGVTNNRVIGNIVSQNVAGIVVAADSPNTTATGNVVEGNTVTGNFIPGIIVHANTPGDRVTNTVVADNTVTGNGADPAVLNKAGPKTDTGILVVAEPTPPGFPPGMPRAMVSGTSIAGNTLSGEPTAIFLGHAAHTSLSHNTIAAPGKVVHG